MEFLQLSTILISLSLVLLSTTPQFSEGLVLTALKTRHDIDANINMGWKFPKDRPYHYANSTKDIPHNFLPVHTNALPEGDGLWVLRYKDFSGLPHTFVQDKSIDTSKSVLTYTTKASIIDSMTVKALAFGDVQLDLDVGDLERISGTDQYMQKSVTKRISLFGQNIPRNCTSSEESSGHKEHLRWTVFEVELKASGNVKLEATIHHPKSFLIIDEIVLKFEDCGSSSGDHEGFLACIKKTRTNRVVSCQEI